MNQLKFLVAGIYFGIVLVKSEAVSWLRIQEMFAFQSFHMYGIICSAVATAAISYLLLKKTGVRTFSGEPITPPQKKFNKGYIIGGIIFGIGWAVTGACPGPLYAVIGAGNTVAVITLISAFAGTFLYSVLRPKLPH